MKHGMFQRSISLLLALVMILGNMPVNAWATETEETPAPACAHSYEAVTTAAATCTEAGTVVYTCSCGDTYTETVAATGHSYAAETTAAATCTEAGTVVYTCGCGDTYTETVAATGHSFSDWTVEAEATYEAAGSRTRVCAVCSAVETEVIPQLQKEAVSGETRKIYFLNTEEWDEVYVRWFFDEEKYADASFPGEKMDEDKDLEAVYVIEVPVEADAVTFNDGVEVTAELLAREDENDIEAIHFFEAELNADLDYFSADEQVEDEENATEWLSYEDLHKAWEEAKKAEEDAAKQPVMDNAPQGETTDPAQALIDALPASVNSQEEYDAVYAIVDQLEQAGYIDGLTDEQLARAMDAINAADLWYAGEEAGNYAEEDGWYWDGTTLYIKDGKAIDLYAVLTDDSGINLNPQSYAGTGRLDPAYSAEIKYSTTQDRADRGTTASTSAIAEGLYYVVATSGGSAWTGKWGSEASFTVKHYYEIKTAVAENSPDTARITLSTENKSAVNVNKGGTIKINVGNVDGYTAAVTDSKGNAVTNLDAYAPTESTTLTVTYTSNAVSKYKVTVEEVNGDCGTATLKSDDELIAGANALVEVVTNANDANHKYEVASVKVGNTELSKNENGYYVYTMGEADVTIEVTYSKSFIEFGANKNTTIEWNGYYQDGTKLPAEDLAELKEEIFTKLDIQGVALADVNIQYYPWYTTRTQDPGYSDADGLTELDGTRQDYSVDIPVLGKVGWSFNEFGERGYKDGAKFADTKEKVRITTADGLWIETEITLTEVREVYTVQYTDPTVIFKSQSDIDTAVQNALTSANTGRTITSAMAADQTLPTGGQNKVLTYNVTVADDAECLGSTNQTVTITATAKSNPADITFETAGAGSGSVNFGGLTANGTLAAGTYTLTVTPSDLDGTDGSAMYVEKVEVNGIALANGTYTNGAYTASHTVANDNSYTVKVTYGTKTLSAVENPVLELNGYENKKFDDLKANIVKSVMNDTNTANYNVHVWIDPIAGDPRYYNLDDKDTFGDYNQLTVAQSSRFTVPAYGETGTLKVKIIKAASSDGKYVALTLTGAEVTTKESRPLATVTIGEVAAVEVTTDMEPVKTAVANATTNNGGTLTVTVTGNMPTAADPETTVTATATCAGTLEYVGNSATKENITVKLAKCTVTWNLDGGKWENASETSSAVYYGATPVAPSTVVKDNSSDGQYSYTFAGWTPELAPVTGNATYTATYTATTRSYTVKWDTNGDGDTDDTTDVTKTVAWGTNPLLAADAPVAIAKENKSFDKWTNSGNVAADGTITGAVTYTATYTNDTTCTVKVKDGETNLHIFTVNVTRDDTITVDGKTIIHKAKDGSEKGTFTLTDNNDNGLLFKGWLQGDTAYTQTGAVKVSADMTLTVDWATDTNNNEVADAKETIKVDPNGGTILIGTDEFKQVNDAHVFDSEATYTIVITPPANHYVATVEGISGVSLASAEPSVTYENGVMTIAGVTLTNGAEIKATYAKHTIEVATTRQISVNGYDANTKLADVTKKAVLEAILGKQKANNGEGMTAEEIAQYDVKMYLELVIELSEYIPFASDIDLSGYHNIWRLELPEEYKQYEQYIKPAFDAALQNAIDVPGTEKFEVTWKAHDKYPEVTVSDVEVKLVEDRDATTLTHNIAEGHTYNASALDQGLLDEVKKNLISNTGIVRLELKAGYPTELVAGEQYDVDIIVTVEETDKFYGATHYLTIKVNVPVTVASVEIKSTAGLDYNTGMTDADKTAMVLEAVQPAYTPALPDGVEPVVLYLASEARTVEMTINLAEMDLGLLGNFLPAEITAPVTVEEMWLNIGDSVSIPDAPSIERIKNILLNDLIPNYGADYAAGRLSEDDLKNALNVTLRKYPDVAEYYKYLGAHKFGENEKKDADGNVLETVYVSVPDYGYGPATSNTCVLTLADLRTATTIELNSGVSVVYGSYTEAQLKAALVKGIYANGTPIEADVSFTKNVESLPVGTHEVTVKFNGNEGYKSAEATSTITITKAPVTVNADHRMIKWQENLSYELPISTTPAGVDMVTFVAGLDISSVNMNGAEVNGILGSVQLLLPDGLQNLLVMADDMISAALGKEISFADGASMKLSDLKSAANALESLLENSEYAAYTDTLVMILENLPTEVADIEIRVGGNLPTNIGAYLVGGVTADTNYETAVNAAIVVITPDGIKTEIDWVNPDENNIFTQTLLTGNYLDAQVVSVADGNKAAAEAQIVEMFLGIDVDGKITLTSQEIELNVGAYAEVALVANWGNQMYYSNVLARPVVVIAESLNVDFVDGSGAVNNERLVEFDNTTKDLMEGNLLVTYKQGANAGQKVENYNVKYLYVGTQTNGMPYAKTTAPTHAGVYAVTAIVTVRDGNTITHAGVGHGLLTITPTESEISVGNKAVKYDGGFHGLSDEIVATSSVVGLTPDTTIISAGLSANLDNVTGLEAINGNVNVDMPKWLDELFAKYDILEAGYAEGVSIETFLGYLAKLEEILAELNIEIEALNEIADFVKQIPVTTNLTFHDNASYKEVGAYLYVGIVTDSDHYPSAGAGVLVIYPDATEVELQFEADWNNNNIFTWNTLKNMDLEAKAYGLNGGTEIAAATDKVVDLYFGFTDNGEFLLEAVTHQESIEDVPEFDNGVYTQLSMLLDLSNKPYYAEPISRVFIIAPNKAAVEFVDESGNINDDRHFVFDNQPHAMAVSVNGVKMAPGEHEGGKKLDVLYVGVQTNGVAYTSTEAPVHSGAYTVTAVYTEKDGQGRYVTLGNALGAMVIEPAKAEIAVDNAAYEWHKDLKVNVTDQITVSHNVAGITSPDTTIITAGIATDGTFSENGLNAINTDINIDFPAWADEVIAKIDGLEDGMTVAELTAIIDKVDAAVSEYEAEGYELEIFDKLKNVLNQLPADKHVTFTDAEDLEFSAVGTYLVVGIVTDSDFYPAIDAGVLLIYPDVNEVTLDWIYKDSNNIFTKDTLKVVDLGAKVVEENIPAEPGVLFLGVEAETFEIVLTNDQKVLNIGVYDEIGYLVEVGSVSYYAKPIDRVISVVAGGLDMIFVDETGAKNHDRLFTYDGKQHSMETVVVSYMQDLDGRSDVILDTSKQSNDGNLSFYYTGVQTNGAVYASKTAPTEAGTYTVTATYVLRDAQSRLVTHVGAAVGVLVIEPAEATITVGEKLHKYDGQSVAVADMISVTSENGLKPDTTIISARVNTDGSFSEEGLKALTGNINIDFPAWVDEILTKVYDYNEIVVAQLIEEIEAVETIVSHFEIEGHELEIFDNLKNVLSQMDQNAKVTFKDTDELAYSAVGTYIVVGVVTDSNYYPAMDAGVLVIYPNVELGTLEWKNADKNNIFYLDSLTSGYLDAKALFEGVEDATVDPTEIYIGVDADNWLIHLSTQQPDSVGVYTEIAVLNDTNSNAHYAMPIMRPVIVVDGIYDVLFHDENGNVNHDRLFTYDGTAKEIGKVYVYGYDKGFYQDAVPAEDELKILYIGTDSTGDGWMREEAPTDAGMYTVVATYTDYENGKVVGGGAGVGTMIIEKADMALDMKDTTVTYDGNGHFVDVTSEADDPDYLTVIVDKNENTINFILEEDLTIAGGVFKTLLEKALGRELADNAFNVTEVQQAIHKVIDEIETFEIPDRVIAVYDQLPDTLKKAIADLKSSTYEPVKAKVDEVLALIQNEIPQSGTVIFNGDLPKNVGEYQFYGFALAENYEPQATQGVLTIKPVQIKVTAGDMTKVYGEADPELTYTVQYFDHEGNALTNISTDVAVEISRAVGEDIGEYAITATVENGNYEIVTVSGTLTITPKAITVKVDDKEKFVGDKDPQFTATYDGMVGSDTLSITFSREQGETAGDYAITATVAENKNYTVTVVPGTLTIKEKVEDDQKTGFQIIIEEPELVDKIVEIDGIEYQLVDGKLIISEDTAKQWMAEGTKLMTAYAYKEDASDVHKEYPTAMYVWVLTYDTKSVDNAVVINEVRAVRIKELDNYLMYEGTSIRINFVNDAIRFFTSVTPGGYSGLKNGTLLNNTGTALDGAKMLEMGTRAKKFNDEDRNLTIAYGAGDIVFGAGANADGQATDGLRKYGDGTRYVTKEACYLFTGAMENLPTSKENLNLEFVVRPYVTLQLQNGQTTTLYGGKYQRTISYVAYQNQSFMAGTAYNAYIQNIINISGIDRTTGKIS